MRQRAQSCLLFGALAMPSTKPTIEINGFRLNESQDEKRTLEMNSKSAQIFKAENIAVLRELQAIIYDKSDQAYVAVGKEGLLDTNSQNFEIKEESYLLSPDGYRFQTPSFSYQAATKRFQSNEDVEASQMVRSGASPVLIKGKGFFLDLKNERYQILSQVRAEQRAQKGQKFTIRSNSAYLDPVNKSAIFQKNVRVLSSEFEVNGQKLEVVFSSADSQTNAKYPEKLVFSGSDKNNAKQLKAKLKGLEVDSNGLMLSLLPSGELGPTEAIGEVSALTSDGVKMQGERMQIKNNGTENLIELIGQVKIITKDRIATCKNALYTPSTGQVLLKEIAAVKGQGQNIEGDTIRFSTRDSEVFVEKAKGQIKKEDLGL